MTLIFNSVVDVVDFFKNLNTRDKQPKEKAMHTSNNNNHSKLPTEKKRERRPRAFSLDLAKVLSEQRSLSEEEVFQESHQAHQIYTPHDDKKSSQQISSILDKLSSRQTPRDEREQLIEVHDLRPFLYGITCNRSLPQESADEIITHAQSADRYLAYEKLRCSDPTYARTLGAEPILMKKQKQRLVDQRQPIISLYEGSSLVISLYTLEILCLKEQWVKHHQASYGLLLNHFKQQLPPDSSYSFYKQLASRCASVLFGPLGSLESDALTSKYYILDQYPIEMTKGLVLDIKNMYAEHLAAMDRLAKEKSQLEARQQNYQLRVAADLCQPPGYTDLNALSIRIFGCVAATKAPSQHKIDRFTQRLRRAFNQEIQNLKSTDLFFVPSSVFDAKKIKNFFVQTATIPDLLASILTVKKIYNKLKQRHLDIAVRKWLTYEYSKTILPKALRLDLFELAGCIILYPSMTKYTQTDVEHVLYALHQHDLLDLTEETNRLFAMALFVNDPQVIKPLIDDVNYLLSEQNLAAFQVAIQLRRKIFFLSEAKQHTLAELTIPIGQQQPELSQLRSQHLFSKKNKRQQLNQLRLFSSSNALDHNRDDVKSTLPGRSRSESITHYNA